MKQSAGYLAALLPLATLLSAGGAPAATAPPFLVDVSACLSLPEEAARLNCYAEQVSKAQSGLPAAEPSSPVAQPASTGRPATGLSALPAPAGSGPSTDAGAVTAPAPPQDPGDQALAGELQASITGLRETVPDRYVITLDNGQVWRQSRPQKYPLREGQQVRLYPTRWGESFRLSAKEVRGFIQVERLQ